MPRAPGGVRDKAQRAQGWRQAIPPADCAERGARGWASAASRERLARCSAALGVPA